MARPATARIPSARGVAALSRAEPPPPGGAVLSTVTGDLRLHRFRSLAFRNTRTVRVLPPPGYDDPANADRRYPVLYLNDGQNLFDRASAFGHVEWQVDETVARLTASGEVVPFLVVGVDHADGQRAREYIPYRSTWHPLAMPAGRRFPSFLGDELMPAIDAAYRTKEGPENTTLGGSSLGAAISLYAAMARPGLVGGLLLESPSLFIGGHRLLRDSRRLREWPHKVYLATGTCETGREQVNAAVVANVLELERTLRGHGLGEDRLRVAIEEGATHSEAAWAARLPAALTFLFGAKT